MKILAIGNSFSIDATRYLHQIAEADGVQMKVVGVAIGGCSLRKHYINALENNRAYGLYFNGDATGFLVSIKEALISDEWDVITIQQVSTKSTDYNTFQPYLQFMGEYIRKYSPEAKLYLQQTWAYEDGSQRLCEQMKYRNAEEMLADVRKSYRLAAEAIHADGIIPSGEVMYEMVKRGIPKVHRDTFHASLGLGRYALGLTWYAMLTGRDIMNNQFMQLDEETSEEERTLAKQCVRKVV